MRKVLIFIENTCVTIFLSIIALFVSLFDSQGRAVHYLMRLWARIHLRVSGITVVVTGRENVVSG